ncbi:MAG TPA: helix-hairpin-helix domain-containing protein [Thermoanaerobaculia bacterium]|jgi:competence protein ComEA|nr:helix-hairpin-helix domain-containing protein [Thermoanaerobaculia bacterium]
MKRTKTSIAFLLILVSALASLPAMAAETKKVVNINSADASQLALLPRVGPSVADRIVDYRKENGPFKKIEDLMLVQGIGEKTFQLLKPYLAISGESTLKEKVHGSRSSSGKSKSGGKAGRAKTAPPQEPSR